MSIDIKNITTIVSEIDGVLTDNKVDIGELNITISKKFNVADFEAINLLKKSYNFIFISNNGNINLTMCRKRNIPFFLADRSKREALQSIRSRYNISMDEILYVGANYTDIECMTACGVSACPSNSVETIFDSAKIILPAASGEGVISSLYEMLRKESVVIDRGNVNA